MRLLWADILKVAAIYGVILLHVSAPLVVPFEPSRSWWVGNIYDSLTRWCVPLFVMVSGALLLPKAGRRPLRDFFLVRVRKILVPFLVWSAVYYAYRMHVKGDAVAWSGFLGMLLTEPIYYHMWFVYMLIVLYLFAPAISAFLDRAAQKYAWYVLGLWFLWTSVLPIFDHPLDFEAYYTPDMDDYSALRLSGYFLLGHMLSNRRLRSGMQLLMTVLLFMMGAAGTILGTYWLSLDQGEFDPFFYRYYSITVVVMTISLFLLAKTLFNTREKTSPDRTGAVQFRMTSPRLLQHIGVGVFGVYLIHAMVLELLRDGRLGFTIDHTSAFGLYMTPAVGLPVFASSIFVFSLALVSAIRLVPIVRDMFT